MEWSWATPISKLESHISDKCSYYNWIAFCASMKQAWIQTGFHRFKEIGQIFHYNYILSKKL